MGANSWGPALLAARTGLLVWVAAFAASCASQKGGPAIAKPATATPVPPICSIETAAGADKPLRDRTFPPQNWFVLMLHAYRSTGEIARPLNDCSGSPVQMDVDGCGRETPLGLTPTALTSDDLIVTSLGDARRLVWVITERVSDGQGQGPVAIAEVQPRGISVRAIGVLRAFPEHVSLRLERLGGGTVLVADGERCDPLGTAGACERAIRIVPLVGERFVSKPLIEDKGTCVGSSLLPVRIKGRAERFAGAKYEVEAAVTFTTNALVIREHLALSRAPAARGFRDQSGESFVARLQLERQVTLRDGRLVTDGPSLLARWLAQQETAASRQR